ncbi:flavin reductase family protein [Rheinheimera sp.]|uniref:flavin reductase family protein n=1 Tax=Rheinheimera sp. TaxID=1869214 RepID=UPI003AF58B90
MWIDVKSLQALDCYRLLTSLVTPRPIAWVSSYSKTGVLNLAPFSFFQMVTDQPPTLMISTQHKADGSRKDTSLNIAATGECVINLVPYALIDAMNQTAAALAADESEVALTGLATVASAKVAVPRLELAPAAFECTLAQLQPYPAEQPSCELIFLQVQSVYLNPAVLNAQGRPDPHKLDLVSRLGGSDYSRVAADVFSLQRPASGQR